MSATARLFVAALTVVGAATAWSQTPVTPEERLIQVGRPAGEKRHTLPAETEAVWVPATAATVGCVAGDVECFDDEKPVRRVTLSRGLWLDATEVTVAAFRRFTRAGGQAMPPMPGFSQTEAHPVVNVSWAEAAAYCAWAGGRLPTETEWEVAARGGNEGSKYPTGMTVDHDHANYDGVEGKDRWAKTAPVGSFAANGFGLFDMAGNVWEWTADWYEPHPPPASSLDPHGPAVGTLRVVRGGAFNVTPRSLRASNRGKFNPTSRMDSFGFRCAYDDQGVPATSPAATPAAPPTATAVSTPPAGSPRAAALQSVPSVPATAPAPAATTTVPLAPTPVSAQPSAMPAANVEVRRFPPADDAMAHVAAGTFEMGAVRGDGAGFADEQPRHTVTISRSFWIGVTEVTFAAYRRYAEATGARMPHTPNWADDTHPVVGVTWEEAASYCRWAGGRLPSEAEWEMAARGGKAGLRYPWGPEITHDDANFDGTGGRDQWPKSSPSGSFPANGYGLFDVAGNVWEWTTEWYEDRYYAASPTLDPRGPETGRAKVVRGGCWTSDPGRLRTSYRFSLDPSDSQVSVGFRCVSDGAP